MQVASRGRQRSTWTPEEICSFSEALEFQSLPMECFHTLTEFGTTHFHSVWLFVLSCTECIFLPNSREVWTPISAYTMQLMFLGNIGTTKAERTDDAVLLVIPIRSVDFIEQRVLNL